MGQRSDAGTVAFDWGMTVSDTSLPKALAPNVVIGAKVIGSSFPDADGSEGIEGMLMVPLPVFQINGPLLN